MAVALEFLRQQFTTVPDLPSASNLAGRTILITGTTSGLGLDAARIAASLKPEHLIVRSPIDRIR